MANASLRPDDEQFIAKLEDSAKQLVDVLQNQEYKTASKIIHELIEARDKHIFNSVGQLTRALHTAIVNFNVDADVSTNPPEIKNSEISDASDRLHYVLSLTQAAADKTMDKVEAVAPIAMNLGQEAQRLQDEWSKLKRREMTKEQFKALVLRIDEFLEQMGDGTTQLNKSLQDIILEQGFQDLTGQALKKVIELVTDVERELVDLMRIAGQVEVVTGLANEDTPEGAKREYSSQGEGPAMHADKRDDVVSGQDDVDDLLSSLGF
ncbi:protein phosphatase CheZ [Agaribacterium haliotis]|uniref:protein phosphatase CheZ n=1 Tax=Agaribacterium haliotis TaxID=2013869 RepID=UPI000BB55F84|nr:protein phosphatase CheZ [Agaribacterium haliotis]